MTETTEQQESFEMLRPDEFMERLKVGRTTVHDWKKKGILKPGKHYIQNGHVVRFIWTKEVVLDLCDPKIMKVGPAEPDRPVVKKAPQKRKQQVGINLDY